MTEVTEQDLEDLMSKSKNKISLADALARLEGNPDFKKIITEGYLKTRAIGLVAEMGTNKYEGQSKTDIDRELMSIGKLRSYFDDIYLQAEQAKNTIDACLIEISEINAEAN